MMINVIAKFPGFNITHFRQTVWSSFKMRRNGKPEYRNLFQNSNYLVLKIMDMSYVHKFSEPYPLFSHQTNESLSQRNSLFGRQHQSSF